MDELLRLLDDPDGGDGAAAGAAVADRQSDGPRSSRHRIRHLVWSG
jgi:hypothetical protein